MIDTFKITKEQLIFTDDNDALYVCNCSQPTNCSYCSTYSSIPHFKKTYVKDCDSDYKIPFGTVMCMCTDRCPSNDLFVVLEHTDNYIKCIFPRMRYINGTVILGADKLTAPNDNEIDVDDKYKNYECKCVNDYLNNTMCDGCKVLNNMKNVAGFVINDNVYKIYELKNLHHFIYIEEVSKNSINTIDSNEFVYLKEFLIED